MENENVIREKYLPIGTVVLLKNGIKRIMINGFFAISADDSNMVYDYSGVLFPEGLLNFEQTLLFNHDQIVNVLHLGLIDQEQQDFNLKLNSFVSSNKN